MRMTTDKKSLENFPTQNFCIRPVFEFNEVEYILILKKSFAASIGFKLDHETEVNYDQTES